jgi:hypothetical protein
MAADIKLIVDYKTVKRANQEIAKMGPTAQKAASSLETSLSKSLGVVKRQISFSQKMERQKARESTAAVKATKAIAKEEDRLRNKYVQGHAAMELYTRELNDLAMARSKDIINSDQQKQAVDELNMAMAKGTGAFANIGDAARAGGRKMSSTGMAMQQVGYQAGDFLVQVQGGTNAMVAFGQQATQLVGILPMFSSFMGLSGTKLIALSAGLGIAIPLFTAVGAAFMRTRDKAKESAGSIDSVADALKNLEEAYDRTETSAASFQGIVESFNARQVAAGYVVLAEKVGDTFGASLMDRAVMSLRGYGPDSNEMKVVEANLQKAFGVFGISSADVFGEGFISSLEQAITNQDIATLETIITSLDAFGNRNPMGDQFIQDLIEAVNHMKGYNSEVIDAVDELEKAVAEGEKLRDLEMELGVDAAAAAAKLLADRLGISVAAAERMVGLATGQGVMGPEGAVRQMQDKFTGGLRTDSIVFQGSYDSDPDDASGKSNAATTRAADSLRTYKAALKEVMALEAERTALVEPMARAFTDGFTSMVDGTMKVKDAFKAMALDIVKQLWKIFVVEQMVNSITGAFGIGGGSGMTMTPKANPLSGLSGAQMLPPGYSGGGYTGNGSRSGGMDGEGGFLAMLHPRETVVDHTKGQATGGDTINISQSFNFSANGDESVKKIIAQAAPQIAQMTQKSMMDQRRRGGAMKSTFG